MTFLTNLRCLLGTEIIIIRTSSTGFLIWKLFLDAVILIIEDPLYLAKYAKIKETFNVHENIFESSKSPRIGPILHLSLSEKPDEPEGSNDASGLHSWHWMRGFYERIEAEKFDNMQNTQWTNKYLKYALKIGNFIPEFPFLPDISSLFILMSKLEK